MRSPSAAAHPEISPRDPAEFREAQETPDMGALDKSEDLLTEAFSHALSNWRGDLPRTRMEFEASVVVIFRAGLEEKIGALGLEIARLRAEDVSRERCEVVLHLIAIILDSSDAQLTADCLAFASGLSALHYGISEDAIAEKYGIGVAAVSKRVTAFQRLLDLPASRGMKPESARELFAANAHRRHGTEPAPAGVAKKTPNLIAAVGRIVAWARAMRLESLAPEQRAELRPYLAPLWPVLRALE